MKFAIALLLLLAPAAPAEIVDRVAVAVGRQVITLSQIHTEVRVTAFIEGQKVDLDAMRQKATSRLIDQTLIRKEIEITRFPTPKPEELEPLLKQVKNLYGPRYGGALKEYELTEDEVKQHLLWQLTFLRFVQYRFQPGVQVTEAELQDEFATQTKALKDAGRPAQTFEQMRTDLETLVTQKHVDEALERWLAEQRTQTSIIYRLRGIALGRDRE
ncbi:hypothetical protein F183_A25140 [Bryobacterales bacterium F-183]|nr:hypothetical protein F183_A25140 [Bryobacterales bacterium F-183]